MATWRVVPGLIGCVLGLALTASAEGRTWDATGVRVAAEDLISVGTLLRTSLDRTSGGEARLANAIDGFVAKADALRDAVQRGEGKTDTWPLYLELRASRLRIAEQARIEGVMVTKEEVEAFQAVFREVESYFEP